MLDQYSIKMLMSSFGWMQISAQLLPYQQLLIYRAGMAMASDDSDESWTTRSKKKVHATRNTDFPY